MKSINREFAPKIFVIPCFKIIALLLSLILDLWLWSFPNPNQPLKSNFEFWIILYLAIHSLQPPPWDTAKALWSWWSLTAVNNKLSSVLSTGCFSDIRAASIWRLTEHSHHHWLVFLRSCFWGLTAALANNNSCFQLPDAAVEVTEKHASLCWVWSVCLCPFLGGSEFGQRWIEAWAPRRLHLGLGSSSSGDPCRGN